MCAAKQQQPLRIFAFGDSLTAGCYRYGQAYHPYAINLTRLLESANIPTKIDQQGKNGEFAVQVMPNRLRDHLAKSPSYDWIILLGGTNDIIHRTPAEKIFREGLQPMYEMCLNHGDGRAKLVILTTPELEFNKLGTANDKERQALNTMIRDYVARNNQQNRLFLVDLDKCIPYHSMTNIEERKTIWDEGIHFNPAGYDRMATYIFDVIKTNL